jgi:leucyl/phenylalanyl-tRNA---protein transferase
MSIMNPIEILTDGDTSFPPVQYANDEQDGFLALSNYLNSEIIVAGYKQSVFPWFCQDGLYFWFSPNPRCVFDTNNIYISKSMARLIKQQVFKIDVHANVQQIMQYCQATPRKPAMVNGVIIANDDTWITEHYIQVYSGMQHSGNALGIATLYNGKIVGGFYGVLIGRMFFGESMFSLMPNASKFALIQSATYFKSIGVQYIDCQMQSEHLLSMGAQLIPRPQYLKLLSTYCT